MGTSPASLLDLDLPEDFEREVERSQERPRDWDRIRAHDLERETHLGEGLNFLCSATYSFASQSRIAFRYMSASLSHDLDLCPEPRHQDTLCRSVSNICFLQLWQGLVGVSAGLIGHSLMAGAGARQGCSKQ